MVAHVVTRADRAAWGALKDAAEQRLRDRLGVKLSVELAAPGELDAMTETNTSPKPKRFRDERE